MRQLNMLKRDCWVWRFHDTLENARFAAMIRASMSSADPRREPNSLTDLQEASDFVAVTNCVLLMFSFKLSSAKMGSHFSTVASTAVRLWSCTVVSSAYRVNLVGRLTCSGQASLILCIAPSA